MPLALETEFDFPHMTLVKLESGEAERLHNETIWKSSVTQSRLNVSQMLTQINHDVKCAGLPFRLIPVHVEQCNYANRYNLTGGEGRDVFRALQAFISRPLASQQTLLHLGLLSKLKLTRASRATFLAMPLDNQGGALNLGRGVSSSGLRNRHTRTSLTNTLTSRTIWAIGAGMMLPRACGVALTVEHRLWNGSSIVACQSRFWIDSGLGVESCSRPIFQKQRGRHIAVLGNMDSCGPPCNTAW